MQYFTQDYIEFFKELSRNNNKEWFHASKKRYEQSVKKPFVHFVSALINEVQKFDKSVTLDPKDCISRINRDIRFAKDKTPYNLYLNAFVSEGGKKNKSIPGLYVRLAPEMIGVMGGCYGLDKDQLTRLRQTLSKDSTMINSLINHKDFIKNFGKVRGDKMKRIPKELQSAAEREPLILQKNLYYMTELDANLIHSESLLSEIIKQYKIMLPLNEYLKNAISP